MSEEKVQTFVNQAAQGDVYLKRVDSLPEGLEEVQREGGDLLVAHSETGHHHVMRSPDVRMYKGSDPMTRYLKVSKPSNLLHLRTFDTHGTVQVPEGIFRVRYGKESVPGGWRKAMD